MLIKHCQEIPIEIPKLEGTKGVALRWLIAQRDGAKHYAMRLFEIEPGGIIPPHDHKDSEHEIFVVEGEAILETADKKINIQAGDAIFVQIGDRHSFINNSNKPFKFICVIPIP